MSQPTPNKKLKVPIPIGPPNIQPTRSNSTSNAPLYNQKGLFVFLFNAIANKSIALMPNPDIIIRLEEIVHKLTPMNNFI